MTTSNRTAVLGLGNTLLGDDAVGPEVVRRLDMSFRFAGDVVIADLGTPGLDLTPYLLDVDSVLFVDAVELGAPAGTVRLLDRDSILSTELSPRVSPHDPGVQQALQVVELAQGRQIDAAVLGVQPASLSLGAPLSAPVAAALPHLQRAALSWLAQHEIRPLEAVTEHS